MSPKRRYLQSVKGHWRYRRRWPNSVSHKAQGEFFLRHLGTSDLAEAIRLRPLVDAEFDADVAALSRSIDKRERQLGEAEAFGLVAKWFLQTREHVESMIPRGLNPDAHDQAVEFAEEQAAEASEQIATGDTAAAERHAEALLAEHGIKAERSGAGYARLLALINRGRKELALMERAWLVGDYSYKPVDPDLASMLGNTDTSVRRTIGDLITGYQSDKAGGWSPSTVAAYGPVWRLLKDALGESRDVATVKREDGRRLFELVKGLPRGLGKLRALRDLPVPQAVERGAALGLPTLSPKSINDTYMSFLGSIFKWAVAEQWMDANPVDGLRVHDGVAEADKRDPFTMDQLNTIFTGDPWGSSDGRKKARSIQIWAPLIALYLGMRRGEIAQLETADVQDVAGTPVILIRTGGTRRLKTANARRMLPVHPELLRMGFLQFVDERRKANALRLFEGELPDSRGKWGDGLSDWFLRLLTARGVSGVKLGMHSFRHNWQDRLREAGLHGTAIGQELAGRAKGGDTSNNYGSGFSTAMLAEAVSKIQYPSLTVLSPPPTS